MMSRLRTRLSSIATQLGLGLVGLVSAAVLVTAGILLVVSLRAQTRADLELQQERSRAAAAQIDNFFDDLIRRLGYLARLRGLTEVPLQTQQDLIEALLRSNQAFSGVVLADREGRVVSSAWRDKTEDLGDLSQHPAFLLPLRRGQDYVGYVEPSRELGLPVLTLALPVRDRDDRVDGVVLARINLRFLWSFLSHVKVGETGYAYAVDQRLFVVARKGEPTGALHLVDLSSSPFMLRLQSGEPDVYRGLVGEEVVGAASLIPSVHWRVVVELPIHEAHAPMRRLLMVLAMALVVSTVLAIGLSYYYTRRVVVPLEQLTTAAAAVSAGDLTSRVPKLEASELGTLGDTFNQMAERLQSNVRALEAAVHGADLARAEAEQALSIRNRFLLIASHELRTPLTPLTLKLQIARRLAAAHEG